MENKLWAEKYRPRTLDDYVWINQQQKQQVESWVRERELPMILLLSGGPGCGKSSLAHLLMRAMDVDSSDIKFVNASRFTGIDDIRNLVGFVETMPNGKYRYVVLDECLHEDTLVTVLRDGSEQKLPIRDLDGDNDLVKSWNLKKSRIEWRPFELIDKGVQETLEIEFENGEVVVCTPSHKWYVEDPNSLEAIVVYAKDLHQYNHILTTE